jgi:purine-binding chemotaxis protein CheW
MQVVRESNGARIGARGAGQKVYGTFLLGETEFAVSMDRLEEVIEEPSSYVPMPMAPPAMLGVSALRGVPLPVMDAGRLLEWSGSANNLLRRLAVVNVDGASASGTSVDGASNDRASNDRASAGGASIGIRFDQTREVLWVSESEVKWLDPETTERRAIAGVIAAEGGNRLIQILDISALVRVAKMPRWSNAAGAAPVQLRTQRMRRQEKRLVSFRVGGTLLGLDSASTVRVITPGQGGGAPLQDSPIRAELCNQAILVERSLLPILRLQQFLGWGDSASPPQQVLVCRAPSGQRIGFAIDGVDQLIPYQEEDIREVPIFSDYQSGLFRGCLLRQDRDPLILLHETDIFSAPAIAEVLQGHARLSQQEKENADDRQTRGGRKKADLLVFRIGSLFGIRIAEVLEILDARQDFIRLPQSPPALVGTFGIRGEAVAVVDPRKLFGFPGERRVGEERILIFSSDGKRIGMLVDSVESILHWSEGDEELPDVFFQDLQQRMGGGFEKGLGLAGDSGRKQPMVLLHARQVVEKLRSALDGASPAAKEAA